MTSTATGRPSVIVIDIEDTVTIHYPEDMPTTRIVPPPRRPAMDERPTPTEQISFALVPGSTGELPLIGGGEGGSIKRASLAAPARTAPSYLQRLTYAGTRRAPGRIARLLGLDGIR